LGTYDERLPKAKIILDGLTVIAGSNCQTDLGIVTKSFGHL
jgi:hypothetical protein